MKKIILTIMVLFVLFGCSSNVDSSNGEKNETNTEVEVVKEESVESKIKKDFEVSEIELALLENNEVDENSNEIIRLVIFEKNDEAVVLNTINKSIEIIEKYDINKIIKIDIKDKDRDYGLIATYIVGLDGEIERTYTDSIYYTDYKKWINSQFSVWNGQHDMLVELVKKQLNDEKSFDHIETNYRVISDEVVKDEVNNILKDGGYSNRVEVNDLIITMQFSAKNGFNATIKNTAIGIASYSMNTITLVDFGS